MALPELTLPPSLPAYRVDGHNISLVDVYAETPMRTGHSRRRRIYTVAPRVVSVSLDLTLDQALAFHDWFEGPLAAGAQEFSAQVANQGPGLLWWRARFLEPYTAEANESGQAFWITAKLLLTGDGSSTGPYVANMASAVIVALSGTGVLTAPTLLGSDITVDLLVATPLRAAILVSFDAVKQGAPASDNELDIRWSWDGYPYAHSRNSDVTETQELNQRTWMRV